jgi:DNA adenine methylase
VLMCKPRSEVEVYNDIDGDIVNLFRVLRDEDKAKELQFLLECTPYSRNEFFGSYTPSGVDEISDVERARRTLVRGNMGWQQTPFDEPSRGAFRNCATKIADGGHYANDWAGLHRHVDSWVDRLRGVVIEEMDAIGLIRKFDAPHVAFYVDPPYLAETRTNSKKYRKEMADAELHVELASILGQVKGSVVVSGYQSELYDSLYAGWTKVLRSAATGGNAKKIEALWISPNSILNQPGLFGEE